MTSSSSSQPVVHLLDVLRAFPSPATSLDVYSHHQDDSLPRPEPYVRRSSPTPSSTISSYHSELGLRRGRTRDIHPDDDDDAASPRPSSLVSTAQTSLRYSNPSPELPPKAKDQPILLAEENESQRSQRHSVMEHEEVILALDACRFHAGDRLPADPFWRPRWEMANVHVALWNGLEQVYLHAPHITIDRLAFSRYASAVVHAIETHHDIEEEYFFPLLEVSISMRNNLEQHASFDDGIRALKFYLKSCINEPSIFDPVTVLAIIDTFAIELATHFADELETLDPNVLRESFSVSDLDKQGASLQKHIVKDYKRHLYTALPVLIVNTPPAREWPLLSPLVKRILLPLILGRKYKTSWQYGKWPGQLNVFGNARSAIMSFTPLPTTSSSSDQVAESVSSGSITATTQRNNAIPKSARSLRRLKAEEAFRGVRTAAVASTGNELARGPVEKIQGRGH